MEKGTSSAAIGRRLARARETLGLSPAEVAGRLGVTTKSYRAWEQGRREQWSPMFVRLVFEAQMPISTDWLLRGWGAMLLDPRTMERILERDQGRPKVH